MTAPRFVTLTAEQASMVLSLLVVNGRNSCPLCEVVPSRCDRDIVRAVGFWDMTPDSLAGRIRVAPRKARRRR